MPFITDFNRANADINKFLSFINSLTKEGDEIKEIETSDNPILQLFDKYSGIDAVQITKDRQLRGVAIRVQYGHSWNTFTIRYRRSSGAKTEYEKRLEAIKNEKMYPQLTLQCYLSKGAEKVISAAWIKTKDLYRQIVSKPQICKYRFAGEDGNQFLYVNWADLDNILIYENGETYFQDKPDQIRFIA